MPRRTNLLISYRGCLAPHDIMQYRFCREAESRKEHATYQPMKRGGVKVVIELSKDEVGVDQGISSVATIGSIF